MNYHCKICNSNLPYLEKRTGLYHCPSCSTYFLDPRQWPKDLVSFYEQAYRGEDPSTRTDYFDCKQDLAQERSYFAKQLDDAREFWPGPLLDVGCGRGIFLELASRAGFQVSGLEISETQVKSAPRSVRSKIKVGSIDTIHLPKNSFKVVTFFHVIEHLLDPLLALRKIHSVLKPSGAVILVTPNIDSIWAKVLGKRWWAFMQGHIYFFNIQSLKEILRRSDFVNTEVSSDIPVYFSPAQLWEKINRTFFDRSPKEPYGLKLSRPKIPLRGGIIRARASKPDNNKKLDACM